MLLVAAILLLVTVVAGLVRAFRGPSLEDQILAVQLIGSGGVALVLLFAHVMSSEALLDVALVLALLAVMATVALTRRAVGRG